MQECGPAQPYIRGTAFGHHLAVIHNSVIHQLALGDEFLFRHCDIVQNLQGMGEVLLVAFPLHSLDALEFRELGKYVIQQAAAVHQYESPGRAAGDQHLVQFFRNPFLGEYEQALPVAAH